MKRWWFITYVMPLTVLTYGWYGQVVLSDRIPNCDPAHYYDQTTETCLQCPDKTFSRGSDSYACDKVGKKKYGRPKEKKHVCKVSLQLCYYLYTEISSCVICPLPKTKYQCPGFHNFSSDEEITKGGWYLHDSSRAEMQVSTWTTSLLYDKCRDESHCNPQTDAYRFKSEILDIQCAKGHTGSLCFECLYQWNRPITQQSSSCTICSTVWLPIIQIGMFSLGYIIMIILLSLATQHRIGSLLNIITNDSMSVKDHKPFLIAYLNFLFNISMNLTIPIDLFDMPCLNSRIAEMVLRESNFHVQLTFLTWIFVAFPFLCVLFWTFLNIQKARKVNKEIGQEKVNLSQEAWIALCGVESWGMCVWMILYFYVLSLSQIIRYGALNCTCVDRPNSMQSFLILAPDTLCSSLSLNDDILMNAFCLIIAPLLLPTAIILGCYHLSQWKFKLFLNTILGSTRVLSRELVQFYLLQIILLISIKPGNTRMEAKFLLLFLMYIPIYLSIYFTYDSLEYEQINSASCIKSRIQKVWEFWDKCAEFQQYCFISSFLSHTCLCIVVYPSSEKNFQKILIVIAALLQWSICIYMILNILCMEILPIVCFKCGLRNTITRYLEVYPYCYTAIRTLLDKENPLMDYLVHELEIIVSKSPFPAETISQMKKIVDLDNVRKLPDQEVINAVVKQGHIEPQYASCILGQKFLRTALTKEREHSDTGNEKFSEIFLRALENLTLKLGIENQVALCDTKAQKICSSYLLVHRVLRCERYKKEQQEWKAVSDTQLFGDTFSLEKLNRIKAEFRYLFPDARSCSKQYL